MASGVTRISDLVIPVWFSDYTRQLTTEKSRLIQSGAVQIDPVLNRELAGGGLTFNHPSFQDLDNDPENISSDDPAVFGTPNKIKTATEIQVRLSRNNSWSSMDLAGDLAGEDPLEAIAQRISNYWVRRDQAMLIATMKGVFADNSAAPTGGDTHTQNDMTNDISGAAFADGTTNYSAGAFVDAAVTMGDSMDELSMVLVHSVVYGRMLKNNLIDFIPDSINPGASPYTTGGRGIPTFLGRTVVVDDSMPIPSAGVFETWLFGQGAIRMGVGEPKVPVERDRIPAAGNGGGQEIIFNRIERITHPAGYAYVGTSPAGGPSNAATTNNLADAASWRRVFTSRKQIRIARMITREF